MTNEFGVRLFADIKNLTKNIDRAGAKMKAFGKSMKNAGQDLTIGVTAPLTIVGGLALRSAANIETMETAFESMTGSATKASAITKDLIEFTAKTPFQLDGVGQAARQLLAFGVQSDSLLSKLQFLGDISAGANVPLNEMALIFGKARAKGKVMTEELLQLAERGVPIIDVLAAKMNVSKEAIFKMASESKISFATLEEALISMTQKGGIFADQMSKQSSTLAGIWSTLKDNVNLALAEFGNAIVATFDLKENMKGLIGSIQGAVEWFKGLTDRQRQLIVIAGGVAAAIGPIVFAMGSFIQKAGFVAQAIRMIGAAAATNPLGAILTVVGILAATLLPTIIKRWDEFRAAFKPVEEAVKGLMKQLQPLIDRIREFLGEIDFGGILEAAAGYVVDYLIWAFDKLATVWSAIIKLATKVIEKVGDIADSVKGFAEKVKSDMKGLVKIYTLGLIDMDKKTDETAGKIEDAAKKSGEWFKGLKSFVAGMVNAAKEAGKAAEEAKKAEETLNKGGKKGGGGKTRQKINLPTLSTDTSIGGPIASTFDGKGHLQGLDAYRKALNEARLVNESLGKGALTAQQKMSVLQSVINGLSSNATKNAGAIRALGLEYQALSAQMQDTSQKSITFGDLIQGPLLNAVQSFSMGMIDALSAGADGAEDATKKVVQSFLQQATAALVAAAITSSASAGPLALALAPVAAAAAGKLVSSLFGNLVGLADGGIAYGNTAVQVGEYAGVRSNPEVIAPLDKLQSMVGGSASFPDQVEFVQRGEDLIAVLRIAERNESRIT